MYQQRSDTGDLSSLNRAADGVVQQGGADAFQRVILVNRQSAEDQDRYWVRPASGHWGRSVRVTNGASRKYIHRQNNQGSDGGRPGVFYGRTGTAK